MTEGQWRFKGVVAVVAAFARQELYIARCVSVPKKK